MMTQHQIDKEHIDRTHGAANLQSQLNVNRESRFNTITQIQTRLVLLASNWFETISRLAGKIAKIEQITVRSLDWSVTQHA